MSNYEQSLSKSVGNSRETWFQSQRALEYISDRFQAGQKEIRIASGFFTIKGWGMIRTYTKGKHVYLLVGIDDPGEERARKALIEEIMRDLRTGLDRDRRQAVADLVQRMESNQLQIVDARAMDHHAKLYLVDEEVAIMASSNLTRRGLMEQIESGSIVTKPSEVSELVKEFDDYFAQAKDITQELLEVFRRWLKFALPWDIYLKTMLALENLQPIKNNYKKRPVNYQVDMIAQTLRQIREHGGSMLVASTGLGKTVVAVHVALHLRDEEEIDNVMVIGPKGVRKTWKREMREASLPCEYFIRQMLDKKSYKQDSSLEDFEEIANNSDEQRWLLIIDESHEFRNRYKQDLSNMKKNPTERQAFLRLRSLFRQKNPKVLLLTGSPYAKEIDNINNQLFLLPHTAENRTLLPAEYVDDACAWYVHEAAEFINLPVASQLTTPHVARHYGKLDEEENYYISFDEQRRYIPKIILHSINFALPLENELTDAIVNKYFDLKSPNPMLKKTIERLVRVAWASSPLAIGGMLEKIIDTPGGENGYDLEFLFSRERRREILFPILEKLNNYNLSRDIKLIALCQIIDDPQKIKRKVILFCERHATVVYLKQALNELRPSLQVAATIDRIDDSYKMKETKEIEELMEQFAPIANDAIGKYQEDYDVFISTDAHGVGVNMQDASVVINYDIDWTPIGPVQRAGRILRFWHSPRTVEVYTFIPTLTAKNPLRDDLTSIMGRWENLMERHSESRKLIDLPVLTEFNTQEIDMLEMASEVTIESGQLDIEELADLDISPYFQHTAKLQNNREYAESIPSDIISAKTYSERNPKIYVLLKHNGLYRGLFYDPKTKKLEEPTVVKLLKLLECSEDTEIALVDYELVEQLTDTCIQVWCNQEGVDPEDVTRECALYFKPELEGDTVKELLNPE